MQDVLYRRVTKAPDQANDVYHYISITMLT